MKGLVAVDAAERAEPSGRAGVSGLDDAELMRLLARPGNPSVEAFRELYTRYGQVCYSLARRLLRDEHLAQDVVQEAFASLWQSTSYDPARGSVSAWLFTLTHRRAVDLLRRESRLRRQWTEESALDQVRSSEPEPHEQTWALLRQQATRAAMQTLPPEQREVLLLAYYGGYTQREIAGISGIPIGTVKSRTLTALRRLRRALDSHPDVPELPGGDDDAAEGSPT